MTPLTERCDDGVKRVRDRLPTGMSRADAIGALAAGRLWDFCNAPQFF
jgi:hypothetical protein